MNKEHNKSVCDYAHNWQDFRRKPNLFNYSNEMCEKWEKQLLLLTMMRAALTWLPVPKAMAGRSRLITLRPTRLTHASKQIAEIDLSASATTTNKTEDI